MREVHVDLCSWPGRGRCHGVGQPHKTQNTAPSRIEGQGQETRQHFSLALQQYKAEAFLLCFVCKCPSLFPLWRCWQLAAAAARVGLFAVGEFEDAALMICLRLCVRPRLTCCTPLYTCTQVSNAPDKKIQHGRSQGRTRKGAGETGMVRERRGGRGPAVD